jgi:hypothetical protein
MQKPGHPGLPQVKTGMAAALLERASAPRSTRSQLHRDRSQRSAAANSPWTLRDVVPSFRYPVERRRQAWQLMPPSARRREGQTIL